ncbi:MAG: mannitol dehydrogenase family protein [Sporomusaceae bacterium]|nr:mannitol dehydrogenase family protein [Sporomusaceae bacterium]
MKLSKDVLSNPGDWQEKGVVFPRFDWESVRRRTAEKPVWLHFGAGNIFRAFPARAQQLLLDEGLADSGIVVCETFDEEIIDKAFTPFDNLTLAVTLKADQSIDKTLVASITESLTGSSDRKQLERIFTAPSLQLVSFTITEKGYAVTDDRGQMLPHIAADVSRRPEEASSLIGLVAYLCLLRCRAGQLPLALVSMDNCARNGEKLKTAVLAVAQGWERQGFAGREFSEYLQHESRVTFPWSMIDKITPRPADSVREMLAASGIEGMEIHQTAKNTYVAAFVNAEECEYLVIEDSFPNGRPPLEKAGVIFSDRDTVNKVEKMKVGACLNPLHTVLAVFGCLLGYELVSKEMENGPLVRLVKLVGYSEALPYVPDPGIISPRQFIDEFINTRLPNPFIPDSPQRIACDTSQKIPVRFGGTLKEMERQGKDLSRLKGIPFFIAGWLRYLLAVNDEGKPLALSPDPMLAELRPHLQGISLGDKGPFAAAIQPILANQAIFGVDLYKHGLAGKIEAYFTNMVSGAGAVRQALNDEFKEE